MRILYAVLFSLMFHFIFFKGAFFLAPYLEPKTPPVPETIEVTLAPTKNKSKEPSGTVVRQALLPEKLKAPDDETMARFLSEQKQRVKQESQAQRSGKTENRTETSIAPPSKDKPQQKTSAEKKQPPDNDGYRTVDISRELSEMNRFDQGSSTVGESLPTDVRVGSFTALNTDRYIYYTFYARVEDLIRYRWETRVQGAINTLTNQQLSAMSDRNWVTQVEFLLNPKGVLEKALLMKSSGIESFDQAAIRAFQEARTFPNPPEDMVQEDGYIHLQFSFTVNYRPPALVNRN